MLQRLISVFCLIVAVLVLAWAAEVAWADESAVAGAAGERDSHVGPVTWDGRHSLEQVLVKVVYFVPSDRQPLVDWRERAEYFCRSIELFHLREFDGQSQIEVSLEPEPLISRSTTQQLRQGDANAIYYRTLRESSERLAFPAVDQREFPILLVLSDINWRALDDFYRLKRDDAGQLVFEGNYNRGRHFPGAASGGSRASFRSRDRVGWGLVSADGWRVPYRGSDCVVYHEGCGHTVGLPHPEPQNASVMSLGQYHGWLNESWLDRDQKLRLGWSPEPVAGQLEQALQRRGYTPEDLSLYSQFTAIPQPHEPRPGQPIELRLTWPDNTRLASLTVSYQTALAAPWSKVEFALEDQAAAPDVIPLGSFERATPISYRVQGRTVDGGSVEQWGYLQVRDETGQPPQPHPLPLDLMVGQPSSTGAGAPPPRPLRADAVVDLLSRIDPAEAWSSGAGWSRDGAVLVSPKAYGARIEVPFSVPSREYRLVMNVKPTSEIHGVLLGLVSGDHRCVALLNYPQADQPASALENIDGQNVGNETTYRGTVLQQGVTAQVVLTVTRRGVQVSVDGRQIIDWEGDSDRLSLSDYWKTPDERSILIGAYDTQIEISRLTWEPL